MNIDQNTYYQELAKEFESVYNRPERQADLHAIKAMLENSFAQKEVFEVNCGTGYFTQFIAQKAAAVFATDMEEAAIEIAKHHLKHLTNISFAVADFYTYQQTKKYGGLFASFLWSHIQLQDLGAFLHKINKCVVPGGTVVFVDETHLEENNQPITEIDEHGNTFITTTSADGTQQLVRKNFPSENFIKEKLEGIATEIQFVQLKFYWMLAYKTPVDGL